MTQENAELRNFNKFAKYGTSNTSINRNSKQVVCYTRVSGKEQEKNMSLPYQRQVLDEYAKREGLSIVAYFGGKYESAQTDGRKEFQRMLDFIEQNGNVSQILVYANDRFSRTGGGAIKIAEDLRERYGVIVNAISQPTDLSNPTGIFQQNIQFLFSHYDNTLRRQRVIAGMTYKFERGEWVVKPPMGYDIIRINGSRRIVLNAQGKLLKKAFHWKAEGMKNDDIIKKLKASGINMYRQQLCKVFQNPFYCGILAHGMLKGKVVKGNHEAMVSQELFLKINGIMLQSGHSGINHKKEQDELPLKSIMRCNDCEKPLTGYIVRKKNLWYYKCRTTGCKCNKSTREMHKLFEEFIGQYSIRQEEMKSLHKALVEGYHELYSGNEAEEELLSSKLKELNHKLDSIEEKYYALNEMSRETFEKLHSKYMAEKKELETCLERFSVKNSSNLDELISKALDICHNLQDMWKLGSLSIKERVQKLIFPDGIFYDHQNHAFRTKRVNQVFEVIKRLSEAIASKKKGQILICAYLSPSAERKGFEPLIPFWGIPAFQASAFNHSAISPIFLIRCLLSVVSAVTFHFYFLLIRWRKLRKISFLQLA
jgi:site-specific DNA recombinase